MHSLKAKSLHKRYNNRVVVQDISLEVKNGQVVGLLGPNGAGKTTSFYMIVGLIKGDFGNIYIDDLDITKYPMHKRAQCGIGYLPQEASVFRKLTVIENLLAILEISSTIAKKHHVEKAESLLEEFNLGHIRNELGISLSGGERRRVEIARALVMEPCFILLDEPFAGVDPISVNDIKNIIGYLKEKDIGILITDHNVRETLDICEHAYIVNQGTIISEGTPEKITQDKTVRKTYLGENFRI